MKNQAIIFDLIVVFGLMNWFKGSNFAKRAQRRPKIETHRFSFFSNISKSIRDQRLRFDHMAILGLLKMINGLDLKCGTKIH